MIRKNLFYWIFIVVLLSCSDEELKKRDSIFPLRPGNYWIYQTTITSSDDVVEIFPYLDSVWIEKDTIMDGYLYWVQQGSLSGKYFIRDSANCVILRQLMFERIIFSTNRDTLFSQPPVYQVITEVNKLTSVPAGKFRTINCRTLVRRNTGHSDFPIYNENFYTAEQFICSRDIGVVKNVNYYLGGTIDVELVRYKLQ
jgi:hypothetical protein